MGWLDKMLRRSAPLATLTIVGDGIALRPRHPSIAWQRVVDHSQLQVCLSHVTNDKVSEAIIMPSLLNYGDNESNDLPAHGGIRFQRAVPSLVDGPFVALFDDVDSLDDVAEVKRRDDEVSAVWHIELDGWQLPWPLDYLIETNPDGAEYPFEMRGPFTNADSPNDVLGTCVDNNLIIIRGPFPADSDPESVLARIAMPSGVLIRGKRKGVLCIDAKLNGETGTLSQSWMAARSPRGNVFLVTCQARQVDHARAAPVWDSLAHAMS